MSAGGPLQLVPIGWVQSPLTDAASAPKQGDEGAPGAWIVFEDAVAEGLDGIEVGDRRLQRALTGASEPGRPAPRT
ncbi:MAG: hypothetical protein H0W96_03670 [Solirubrobacterales bacterium]|nr:hypothetical protein [Solirubrobacterales bacterium]